MVSNLSKYQNNFEVFLTIKLSVFKLQNWIEISLKFKL